MKSRRRGDPRLAAPDRGRVIAMTAVLLACLATAVSHAESEPADQQAMKPNAADSEKRKLSERILQNTSGARDKLTGKELGPATQRQQQDVVDDLAALVDLLKQSPPTPPQPKNSDPDSDSNPSSDPQDQPPNSSQDSQPKPSRGSKSKGDGGEQNRSQPQDSAERQGESRETKQRADRKLRLENDIWGHLPPALREELLNTYGERMLPQYEDFVRKFYEALSEPSRKQKR